MVNFFTGYRFSTSFMEKSCSPKGVMVAVSATTPTRTKYAVRTVLIKSFGRNLNSRKRLNKNALPIIGNFSASCSACKKLLQ